MRKSSPSDSTNQTTKDNAPSSSSSQRFHFLYITIVIAVGIFNVTIFPIFGEIFFKTTIQQQQQQQQSPLALNAQDNNKDATSFKIETEEGFGKDRVVQILHKAGVEVAADMVDKLPPYSSAVAQYGSEPIIIGLDGDICPNYRARVPLDQRWVGVAGMMNTGTHLLYFLLSRNCHIPRPMKSKWHKYSAFFQVEWGKHAPASWYKRHRSGMYDQLKIDVPVENILTVVTTKDPYHWMGSMCRKSYTTNWFHTKHNCPNLIKNGQPNPARVRYSPENITHHETLLGVWNDYYNGYVHAEFPKLLIRYEDLIFHQEYVVGQVCKCIGGTMSSDDFTPVKESAKGNQPAHVGGSDLVQSVMRYGDAKKRAEGFSDVDREYAEKAVDKDLVKMFGYKSESRIDEN